MSVLAIGAIFLRYAPAYTIPAKLPQEFAEWTFTQEVAVGLEFA